VTGDTPQAVLERQEGLLVSVWIATSTTDAQEALVSHHNGPR
jgi:hypothetical protein